MPRGPLPSPDAERRNAPTIKAHALPAEGRQGPPPDVPAWYDLGAAGRAWWVWAWATPQAAAWPTGTEDWVARRAALQDDLAYVEQVDNLDVADMVGMDPTSATELVQAVMRRLAALASGRLAIMKEMRELDNRLGLNAKAMLELRWSVSPADEATTTTGTSVQASKARRQRTARQGAALKVLTGGS